MSKIDMELQKKNNIISLYEAASKLLERGAINVIFVEVYKTDFDLLQQAVNNCKEEFEKHGG